MAFVPNIKRYTYGFLLVGTKKTISIGDKWATEGGARKTAELMLRLPHIQTEIGMPAKIVTCENRSADAYTKEPLPIASKETV